MASPWYANIPKDLRLRRESEDSTSKALGTATAVANIAVDPDDNVVDLTTPSSGTNSIKLPPASQAFGKSFLFRITVKNGTGNCTIVDGAGARIALTTLDMLATLGNWALIQNYNGEFYRIVDSGIA